MHVHSYQWTQREDLRGPCPGEIVYHKDKIGRCNNIAWRLIHATFLYGWGCFPSGQANISLLGIFRQWSILQVLLKITLNKADLKHVSGIIFQESTVTELMQNMSSMSITNLRLGPAKNTNEWTTWCSDAWGFTVFFFFSVHEFIGFSHAQCIPCISIPGSTYPVATL